ncbi:hypothetical protein BKA69DRAFT_1092717 [Paraphysoderma sedebokerense]|nr:hypothetical protein BKA69DRAFT_1092717 [Paraphysoderma sedebokerense]
MTNNTIPQVPKHPRQHLAPFVALFSIPLRRIVSKLALIVSRLTSMMTKYWFTNNIC